MLETNFVREDLHFPKISIITPSYNQSAYLERTILSVLDQRYPNLEYIIIDGGSCDDSVEIIRRYEKYLAYWVSEPDRGQTHALNKGFQKCTGDYIGWQNSDDIYLPNAFTNFVKCAKKRPGYDIYFGNRLVIDKHDNIAGKRYYCPAIWRYIDLYFKYRGMAFCNQSLFFRKTLLDYVGYLDESFHIAMDYDFFLRCILNGAKCMYIDSFWGAIRIHGEAKTQIQPRENPRRLAERHRLAVKHCLCRGPLARLFSPLLGAFRFVVLLLSGRLFGKF